MWRIRRLFDSHMPILRKIIYIFAEPCSVISVSNIPFLCLLYFFVLCIILQGHGATPVHQNLGFSFFFAFRKMKYINQVLPSYFINTPFERYNQITNNSIPLPSKLNKNDCADKLIIEMMT